MLDYLADFAIVLLITGVFGIILCLVGWLFETFVDTKKIAKWFDETVDDEETDFID